MSELVVTSAVMSADHTSVVVKGVTLDLVAASAVLTPSESGSWTTADGDGNFTITIPVPPPYTPPYTVTVTSNSEVDANVPVTGG